MEPEAGYFILYNYFSEIIDIGIDGIKVKHHLRLFGKTVDSIENCRHVLQKHYEYAVEIFYIPEKNKECGKYHTDTDVEYHQADYREYQHQKIEMEMDSRNCRKYEIYDKGKAEIKQGLDIS